MSEPNPAAAKSLRILNEVLIERGLAPVGMGEIPMEDGEAFAKAVIKRYGVKVVEEHARRCMLER